MALSFVRLVRLSESYSMAAPAASESRMLGDDLHGIVTVKVSRIHKVRLNP